MKRFYETVEGQPATLDSTSSADSAGLELQIMLTNASISANQVNTETHVEFEFSATLLDVANGVIYWRGAYRTDSVPFSRWNVGFNDDGLTKLLGRIFDDLASKGAVAGTAIGVKEGNRASDVSHAQPTTVGANANTPSNENTYGQPSITDADAVPLIDRRGRDAYLRWVYSPGRKAFVIASDGSWRSTWGKTPLGEPEDPVERAMLHCRQGGLSDCKVYAVDDKVVWPFAPAGE